MDKIYKDQSNVVHVIDENFTHLLPQGCIEINQSEAYLIQNPTPVYTFEDIRYALQSAIDIKAQQFEFSDGNSLMLYAGKDGAFRALADTFFTWESSVWAQAQTYKAEVIAGTKPMLSPSEAVLLMPAYPA